MNRVTETNTTYAFRSQLEGMSSEQKVVAFDALQHIRKNHDNDWLLGLLFSPQRDITLEDAVAYLLFCEFIQRGELFLSVFQCENYAHSNAMMEWNEKVIRSISPCSGSVELLYINNDTQGHDGAVKVTNHSLMQVSITDQECLDGKNKKEMIVKDKTYPLEIGGISLRKAVGIIAIEGGLFRLPYCNKALRSAPPGMSALFVYAGAERDLVERERDEAGEGKVVLSPVVKKTQKDAEGKNGIQLELNLFGSKE